MRSIIIGLFACAVSLSGCSNPVDEIDYQRAKKACGDAGIAKASRGEEGINVSCNETAAHRSVDQIDYALLPSVTDEHFAIRDLASVRLTGRELPEAAATRLLKRFASDEAASVPSYAQKALKLDRADPVRIVVERTGLADDSVAGERHVIEYQPDEAGDLVASAYGVQVQCARGEMAENWVKGPCE